MSKYFKTGLLASLLCWAQFALAQDVIPLNTAHAFEAKYQPGFSYSWWFVNNENDTTFLTSKKQKTEEYFWDKEGEFELFLQAKNENNCLSEIISKSFVVRKTDIQTPLLVALPDYIIGYSNSVISGNVSTNDIMESDGTKELVYSLVGNPEPGLTFNPDGSFEYFSSSGFTGKINFTYRACFGNPELGCATSEVIIRILPAFSTENIAPVAATDVFLTLPNQPVSGNLLYNDIDPDGSRTELKITTSPIVNALFGKVEILADGNFTYIPNEGFSGTDKFMYRICDSGSPSLCDSAWIYFVVNDFGGNDSKPISTGDDVFLSQERAFFDVLRNDHSLSGQPIIYNTQPITPVQHGTLQLFEDGSFTYIAELGYYGIDYFVYEVCNTDIQPVCRRGTATILILESGTKLVDIAGNDTIIGNCQPVTLGGIITGNENYTYRWRPAEFLNDPTLATPIFTPGISTEFILTITDKAGAEISDSVFITVAEMEAEAGTDIVKLPNTSAILDGTASTGENLQYNWTTVSGKIESGDNTPNPVVSGFGTYYLEITDLFGCIDTDSVTVQELAQAPVASDDYDTTSYRTEVIISVLDNDTDPKNSLNPSSLTVTMPPFNGTAYVDYNNFTIHYRPNNEFHGNDNFEYQVCNTFDLCDRANVYVMVTDFRFLIPNAFSPNGDNINDYFEILGIEYFEGNSLTIINRWGNKVYEAKNYGINTTPKFWDGKANTGLKFGNEELTTGTYFYVLDLGNGEKPIAGSIYLDR